MFHEVEDQGKRMLGSTVYPDERHDVPMRGEVVYVYFSPEPLGVVSIVDHIGDYRSSPGGPNRGQRGGSTGRI